MKYRFFKILCNYISRHTVKKKTAPKIKYKIYLHKYNKKNKNILCLVFCFVVYLKKKKLLSYNECYKFKFYYKIIIIKKKTYISRKSLNT